MIVVRDIFQIYPEKMKDAQAAVKEMMAIEAEVGFEGARVLTDLVGDYYTLVLESEFPSLAEFEKAFQQGMQHPRWRETYAKFRPAIQSGRREILRTL